MYLKYIDKNVLRIGDNTMKEYIKFQNVKKEYGTGENLIVAIKDINFSIDEGEFVVILGPSGAGKSTILNLLGGMDNVTAGNILIDGKDISGYSDKQMTSYRGTDVGFVFQFYNLIPSLTVLENVSLVKEISKDPLDAKEMLRLVGLDKRLDQFPNQISGGEQQRVSIARAVCKNPKILLCDEPTGALDSETGVVVLDLLHRMSTEYKKTVIVVTHNANIAEVADKVIRCKDGMIREVICQDNPKNISEVVW